MSNTTNQTAHTLRLASFRLEVALTNPTSPESIARARRLLLDRCYMFTTVDPIEVDDLVRY